MEAYRIENWLRVFEEKRGERKPRTVWFSAYVLKYNVQEIDFLYCPVLYIVSIFYFVFGISHDLFSI